MSDDNEIMMLNELTGLVHEYPGAGVGRVHDCGCGLDESECDNLIAIHREHLERGIWETAPCVESDEDDDVVGMETIEETHECEVCQREHTHTVERYKFSPLGLDVERDRGPVTLIIDEYGDWTTEIDDGYTRMQAYWDEHEIRIVVDVVEER